MRKYAEFKRAFCVVLGLFLGCLGGGFLFADGALPEDRCFSSWVTSEVPLVSVEKTTGLCREEVVYNDARDSLRKEALRDFIGLNGELPEDVNISFCFSGGGYRAMVASLGFMQGAEEIGLLGATKYVASLSGSAWMLANVLLRMKCAGCSDILSACEVNPLREAFREVTKTHLLNPLKMNIIRVKNEIWRILKERRNFEAIDLWGIILNERLLSDLEDVAGNPHGITLEPIRDLLLPPLSDDPDFVANTLNFPFPLFSLILADTFPYEWFEVNPFVSGSDYLGCYVPTKAFDSHFEKGHCYRLSDEHNLGWFLAEFGCAYNLSIGDLLLFFAKEKDESWLISVLQKIVDKLDLYETRFLRSVVNNFVWQMDDIPLVDQDHIELADAGIDINIPLPLLLREHRQADVILVCDASDWSTDEEYRTIRHSKDYCDRKGIKFPPVDNPKRIADGIFIFEDEFDKDVPVIIYFDNPIEISTFDFKYSEEQFAKLCDTMKNMVVDHRQDIVDVLRRRAESFHL